MEIFVNWFEFLEVPITTFKLNKPSQNMYLVLNLLYLTPTYTHLRFKIWEPEARPVGVPELFFTPQETKHSIRTGTKITRISIDALKS